MNPPCQDARTSAKKLLALHREDDPRIEIDASVKTMAPLANPANPKQTFDVLEVWGYIYKARGRRRSRTVHWGQERPAKGHRRIVDDP